MTDPQWNASAGQALRRIIEAHPGILNDPDSLAGLLADSLSRQETNVLITALKEGAPQHFARGGTPPEVLVALLKTRLVKERGLSQTSADWAARAWFEALNMGTVPT